MTVALLHAFVSRVTAAVRQGRDRGDVPGWVLVTLMTAGLVAALWAVARGQLVTLLNDALVNVIK